MKAFTKRLKHRRPVAFLLNRAAMASFVLTFLKEGDGHEGFYKKVKTQEACGVPFKQSFTGLLCFILLQKGQNKGGLWRSF